MKKICFIVSMNPDKIGGLFVATYERITRIQERVDACAVIDSCSYDSKSVLFLKTLSGMKHLILKRRPETEQYDNLLLYHLNYKRTITAYLKKLLWPDKSGREEAVYLYEKYRTVFESCDLIHAHYGWPNGYYAYTIASMLGKKFFISFHGSDINRVKNRNLQHLLVAMSEAAGCFFVSKKLLETAQKKGFRTENAFVTFNGVNTEIFDPDLYLKQDSLIRCVGFIGALLEIKGAHLLPRIFYEIKGLRNKAVSFVIIGDGPLGNWLKKECQRLDLEVKFTGEIGVDEVPIKLRQIDVLVMPSVDEGFGLVVLEANALNIPVVGSDAGGIPEAIGISENIIPINDHLPEQMATRVVEILNEKPQLGHYRRRVVELFSWDAVVQTEMAIYETYDRKKA